MDNVKIILESLYNDFLLRDLFAKIMPGGITLASILYNNPFWTDVIAFWDHIGWVAMLAFAGLSWLMGFAVQEIGEIAGVIRQYPPGGYTQSGYRYDRRIAFREAATESEIQQVERYAVIKEAAGNSSTAIFLMVGIFSINSLLPSENYVARFLFTGFLFALIAVALLKSNRSHADKQYAFIDSVIDRKSGCKKE